MGERCPSNNTAAITDSNVRQTAEQAPLPGDTWANPAHYHWLLILVLVDFGWLGLVLEDDLGDVSRDTGRRG